jgi:hypothetical protein
MVAIPRSVRMVDCAGDADANLRGGGESKGLEGLNDPYPVFGRHKSAKVADPLRKDSVPVHVCSNRHDKK